MPTIGARVLLALTLCAGACHRWRPETTPPALGGGTATLRIETRPRMSGDAHRLTLRDARISGDSIVGTVVAEYMRRGSGRWSIVSTTRRGVRVAIATSDVASIARSEISPGRTTALVLGVGAVGLASFIAIGYLTYNGKL